MKKIISSLLTKAFSKSSNIKFRAFILKIIMKLDNTYLSHSRNIMKKHYKIDIGRHSYGCFKVDYSIEPGTSIGSFCSIAPGARIGSMNHPTNFISTHPFLYERKRGFIDRDNEKILYLGTNQVVLEDDVWVGLNAIILPGVKVGKGAVIGAGAVVTKDIPPYSIVGGVPAKVIKKRFSDEQISKLLSINWQEWSDERIREKIDSFYELDKFLVDNYNI